MSLDGDGICREEAFTLYTISKRKGAIKYLQTFVRPTRVSSKKEV